MYLTPLERETLMTAFCGNGDCDGFNIDSRRVRTRVINSLEAKGLIYSQHIEGDRPLTPDGVKLAASLML